MQGEACNTVFKNASLFRLILYAVYIRCKISSSLRSIQSSIIPPNRLLSKPSPNHRGEIPLSLKLTTLIPHQPLVSTRTKTPRDSQKTLSSDDASLSTDVYRQEGSSVGYQPDTHRNRSPKLSVMTHPVLPYTLTHYTLNQHQELTGPLTHHVSLLKHPVGYSSGLSQLKQGQTIVLGDLHGSSQKLLEHLIVTGVVGGTSHTFKALHGIHQQAIELIKKDPFLTQTSHQEAYAQLFQTYQTLLPHVVWRGSPEKKLCLIGDVIGDRGIGDAFILSLLHQLEVSKKEGYPESKTPAFEVVLSNHDHWAWLQWLKDYHHTPTSSINVPSKPSKPFTDTGKASYARTWAISKHAPALKAEHDKLYEWYFKHMKLLSYDPTRKALFTHASVSKEATQALQLLLHREYHQPLAPLTHPKKFNTWVNTINTWFQGYSATQNYTALETLLSHPTIAHFVAARDLMLHPEGYYKSPLPATIATHFIHGHTNIWRQSRMDEAPLPEFTISPNLKGQAQQKRMNLNNSAYKTVDKVLPNENARMLLLTET
ncbi:MAG: hypothetical protein ACKO37_06615 [Vampirovibrionales bacterium]